MSITIKQAVATFIKIREAKAKKERELKDWKASVKKQEDMLEAFIKKEMVRLDMTTVGADGNSAFQKEKDFVNIENKDTFKTFLATKMILSLPTWIYKGVQNQHEVMAEHAAMMIDSGAFELLTLSANKTNCKEYMAENKGLMPDGIKYEKELSIQIRKGKK